MKKIITYILVVLMIGIISGCKSTTSQSSSNQSSLVAVHLTKNSDNSVNAAFDSSTENILNKNVLLEIKLGGKWENIETTQYVLPAVAALIAQGKMKVVVTQEKTLDGGIKSSISFEMNN